jgi:hypothetical protein
MDREDAGVRRDAEKLAVGDDGAGHLGAVLVRLVAAADGVELAGDGAVEIGMSGVDLGIDDGDQHVGAGRDFVDLGQPQLAHDVLPGIAARHRRRRGDRRRSEGVLLQPVDVVRLRDADVLGLELADDVGDRPSIVDAEVEQGAARNRQVLRADGDEAEPARHCIDGLGRDVRRDVEDHFVGNEPGLAARRNAGESGLAGKRPVRQPVARKAAWRHASAKTADRAAITKAAIPGRTVRGTEGSAEIAGGTPRTLVRPPEISALRIPAAASQGGLALRTALTLQAAPARQTALALQTALTLWTAVPLQTMLALRTALERMLRLCRMVERALRRSRGPARERAHDSPEIRCCRPRSRRPCGRRAAAAFERHAVACNAQAKESGRGQHKELCRRPLPRRGSIDLL